MKDRVRKLPKVDMNIRRLYLLAKERYDYCRLCVQQPDCSCSSSAMVNNSRDMLEKPIMRTIIDIKDVGVFLAFKLAPPPRDNSPNLQGINGFENHGHEAIRIANHYAAEPDINRDVSFL
jgi:hypothetical protein